MSEKTEKSEGKAEPCFLPRADLVARILNLDLPARRKAEAIAAYFNACGCRAILPEPALNEPNKRLRSPEPHDMS